MKKYTKKQIQESIKYWEDRLQLLEESEIVEKALEPLLESLVLNEGNALNGNVQGFIDKNKDQFDKRMKELDNEEDRSTLQKAWDFICYAAKKGIKFIFENLFTILKLIALVAAVLYIKKNGIKGTLEKIREFLTGDKDARQKTDKLLQGHFQKAMDISDKYTDAMVGDDNPYKLSQEEKLKIDKAVNINRPTIVKGKGNLMYDKNGKLVRTTPRVSLVDGVRSFFDPDGANLKTHQEWLKDLENANTPDKVQKQMLDLLDAGKKEEALKLADQMIKNGSDKYSAKNALKHGWNRFKKSGI